MNLDSNHGSDHRANTRSPLNGLSRVAWERGFARTRYQSHSGSGFLSYTYAEPASTIRGLLYLINKRIKAQTTSHLVGHSFNPESTFDFDIPYGHT
jgi:hypothetical protein